MAAGKKATLAEVEAALARIAEVVSALKRENETLRRQQDEGTDPMADPEEIRRGIETPGAHPEREFEIGLNEAYAANIKSLVETNAEWMRRDRAWFDQVQAIAMRALNNSVTLEQQVASNGATVANAMNTNGVQHNHVTSTDDQADARVARDRIWNVDEQSWAVMNMVRDALRTGVPLQAINDALASVAVKSAGTSTK